MKGLNRSYVVKEDRPFWKVQALALLTTVATSRIDNLAPNGHPTPADLTSGYALAFWVAAGVAAAAIVTTLLIVRKEDLELAAAESAAGAVG